MINCLDSVRAFDTGVDLMVGFGGMDPSTDSGARIRQ